MSKKGNKLVILCSCKYCASRQESILPYFNVYVGSERVEADIISVAEKDYSVFLKGNLSRFFRERLSKKSFGRFHREVTILHISGCPVWSRCAKDGDVKIVKEDMLRASAGHIKMFVPRGCIVSVFEVFIKEGAKVASEIHKICVF